MKVVFYLNIVSPHQLPLAREVARRVGAANFIYIYAEDFHTERARMGWDDKTDGLRVEKLSDSNRQLLEDADLLYTGLRCLNLLERRAARGLKSYYYSERWFKPLPIKLKIPWLTYFLDQLSFTPVSPLLPGLLRMIIPSYRRMAKCFVRWLNSDPNARYLAVGPWAKKDMLRIGVCDDKIVDWGYFVAPSTVDATISSRPQLNSSSAVNLIRQPRPLKILYIGRLIPLKRVDTIIRAVALANKMSQSATVHLHLTPLPSFTLTIVGDGPEKERLQKLANKYSQPISFLHSVPISSVRPLMRQHDVLVFASNSEEGWGAVVSEALAEGVPAIGTYETGASAAFLPDTQLFHSGDYRELARKLRCCFVRSDEDIASPVDANFCSRPNTPQPSAVHLHLSPSPLFSSLPPAYTPSGAAERLLV